MLGHLPSFLPMVKGFWDSTPSMFHSTSAMYQFSKKLKNLKLVIRELGREKLGNLTKKAKDAHTVLCGKQEVTLTRPSNISIHEEAEAYER